MNTYAYDSANRLTAVSGPPSETSQQSATYAYNGLGDRLSQDGVNYTLDLNAGLTQVLDDGTNTYTYGLGRISQQSGSTAEYFLGDALGSVRQLVDNTGEVTLTKSYAPYGEVLSSAGSGSSTFAFTGEQQDASGLTYLRARYYNPADGRFLSRDTWEGDENQPITYNKWTYANANPVMYTDPSGAIALLAAMGVGFVAGVAIGTTVGLIDRGMALSGECGCDIQQTALSIGNWEWVGYHSLAGGIIGGIGPLLALAAAAPIGAIIIGGAGVVLGGWDLYNTIKIINKEQNGHPTLCTGVRAAIDIASIIFGLGIAGKGALAVWKNGGNILRWVAPGPIPPLGTDFGKLGVVVNDPKIEITQFNFHATEHGVSFQDVQYWKSLPKVVLSQNGGQRFLNITGRGAFVITQEGRIISAYSSIDFRPPIIAILQMFGLR